MTKHRSSFPRTILGLVAIAAISLPATANAYWYHGFWRPGIVVGVVPPVIYAPPPVYYAPPPVYYAPPPVTYTPPPVGYAQSSAPGASCNAGSRICPMEVARPVGATCYCGAGGGKVYGSVQ